MKQEQFDVLVVGCGLLGTTTALILAHYGLEVAVVEKKSLADTILAKTARIDEETMLILEQIGVLKHLLPMMNPLEGMQIVDKKERVLMQFHQETKSSFAPLYGFYQPAVQKVLQQRIRRHPRIHIYEEQEVETIEEKENKITVFISKKGTLSYREIDTQFLLVCNGQYSQIASFLDIEIDNYNYNSAVLCVDATTSLKSNQPKFVQTIYDTDFPVTKMLYGEKKERWEFQIKQEQVNDSSIHEKIRTQLEKLSGSNLQIESSFVYNFGTSVLKEWQYNQRLFIAGDAAHIMPPYLGLGLSAGIKDVYNLAWKLSLRKQNKLTEPILDTYQLERMDNVRYLIKLNLWVKRLFQSSKLKWIKFFVPITPKWLLQKTWDPSSLIKKGIVGNVLKGAGRTILSPIVLNKEAKEVHLNSILGDYYTVLGLDKNPVDAVDVKHIDYLATLQTKFIHLIPSKRKFLDDYRVAENVYDRSGELEEWMKNNKMQYLIIRPDRVLYEGCANAYKLNKALEKLIKKQPLEAIKIEEDEEVS
jgi:3-(3-hydroxy-phenyl)propionate hydroxylase